MAKTLLKSRLASAHTGPLLAPHILTGLSSPMTLPSLAQHAILLPVCFPWLSEGSCSSSPSSSYSVQHTYEIIGKKETFIKHQMYYSCNPMHIQSSQYCSTLSWKTIWRHFLSLRAAVIKFGGRNLGWSELLWICIIRREIGRVCDERRWEGKRDWRRLQGGRKESHSLPSAAWETRDTEEEKYGRMIF